MIPNRSSGPYFSGASSETLPLFPIDLDQARGMNPEILT